MLCHAAFGIIGPWPGIEPMPPAVEAQSLDHWTAREVPTLGFLKICQWPKLQVPYSEGAFGKIKGMTKAMWRKKMMQSWLSEGKERSTWSRGSLFILPAEKVLIFFFNISPGLVMSGNNLQLQRSSPEILLVLLCLTFLYLSALLPSSSGKLGVFLKQKVSSSPTTILFKDSALQPRYYPLAISHHEFVRTSHKQLQFNL